MHESPPSVGHDDYDYAVVVPFFNEEDNVAALLDEIVAAMAGRNAEIVAVDDCSTDTTLARLQSCAERLPQLRVLRHAVNRGQSAALCSGADATRAPWLVTLDGDGQNDPRDIPALLAAAMSAEPRPVMVCGHRRRRRDNALRRLSSRVANGVRSRLLGDATPDTGCGLKLIERAAFQRLPRFDHMHRFLPALAMRDGGRVMSMEVSHRPRLHGQSKYGLWNRLWVGIVDLAGVMWLRRRAFRRAPSEDGMR